MGRWSQSALEVRRRILYMEPVELGEKRGRVHLENKIKWIFKRKPQLTRAVFAPPVPLAAVEANRSSKVVSTDGTATVQCHIAAFYSFPKVIRVSVLRGLHAPRKICAANLNLTESHEKSVAKPEGGNVSCVSNVSTSCSCGCRALLHALYSLAMACIAVKQHGNAD